MKSFVFIGSIFLLILSLTIHPSVNKLKAFTPEASVSLSELFNLDADTEDSDGPPTVEVEEIEKDFTISAPPITVVLRSIPQEIFGSLKVFIPTYVFSIFIPPSL